MSKLIPVGISNRHVHLSEADLKVLFGENHTLTKFKDLSQPGQYAADEKIDVVGTKGTIKGVRVLGPVRSESQVEISLTDSFSLGVKAPISNSGELEGSAGCTLVGPNGEVTLEKGVIVAARHIHMHTSDAADFGVADKDVVSVKVSGPRATVFENVVVRVREDFALELHVDTDEGNAAALRNGTTCELVK